jgi:hypothetical protein
MLQLLVTERIAAVLAQASQHERLKEVRRYRTAAK